jgi:succinoglycan biosynthesis protein ExoL
MKLAYFAHDLADAAVHRRVRLLSRSAEITLLGFRRTEEPVSLVSGVRAVDLGRTFDAKLVRRVSSVARAAIAVRTWQQHVEGADIVMARQLEMLALAALARRRAAPRAALVYECLDIHRLMIGHNSISAGLRSLERRLLRDCDLLAVSSPAFISEYFASPSFSANPAACPASVLVENKVLASEISPDEAAHGNDGPPIGPPWRIGWFGVIRCRRSLHLLSALCQALPGQVEVAIRGRVSQNVIPDFDAVVAATPGMSFLGSYNRHTDLPDIYRAVHFNWVMDFYETPGNSDWLLPNRLYEGSVYGSVPIALASVESGRWLARHGCDVLLNEPLTEALPALFRCMDATAYMEARHKIRGIALVDLVEDDADVDSGFAAVLAQIDSARNGGRPAADSHYAGDQFERRPGYSETVA